MSAIAVRCPVAGMRWQHAQRSLCGSPAAAPPGALSAAARTATAPPMLWPTSTVAVLSSVALCSAALPTEPPAASGRPPCCSARAEGGPNMAPQSSSTSPARVSKDRSASAPEVVRPCPRRSGATTRHLRSSAQKHAVEQQCAVAGAGYWSPPPHTHTRATCVWKWAPHQPKPYIESWNIMSGRSGFRRSGSPCRQAGRQAGQASHLSLSSAATSAHDIPEYPPPCRHSTTGPLLPVPQTVGVGMCVCAIARACVGRCRHVPHSSHCKPRPPGVPVK
jgi:hypothetical protein